MMQVRPFDLNRLLGVEFGCECGGMARMGVDEQGKGITCAVSSPDVTVRVLLKPTEEEREFLNDELIIEEL